MDQESILVELNFLIVRLNGIIDIMIESTKEVIDIGNVNYELKDAINKLDIIIDELDNTNDRIILETAKGHMTYASLDILDDSDIFYKIRRLGAAENILIEFKTKLDGGIVY
jgi:hypothetical protein